MDAEIPIEGLIEEFNGLLSEGDFEGAEELLAGAVGGSPHFQGFLHYQYGRLYKQWNKLSSAIVHLTTAAEMAQVANDRLFVLQVLEELKDAKRRQLGQRP